MENIDLLKLLLPDYLVEYFDVLKVDKKDEELHLFFEEKNQLPLEFKNVKHSSKGFFDEITYILVDTQLPKLIKIMIGDSQNFPIIVEHYKQNVINVALSQLALFLEKAHQKKLLNVPEPMLTAQLIIAPFILSVLMQVLFFGEDKQADRARIQALLQVHQKILMNYLTATQ